MKLRIDTMGSNTKGKKKKKRAREEWAEERNGRMKKGMRMQILVVFERSLMRLTMKQPPKSNRANSRNPITIVIQGFYRGFLFLSFFFFFSSLIFFRFVVSHRRGLRSFVMKNEGKNHTRWIERY